jgi:heme/copper-type cytochrome/quinol oxidase subunit 2
MGIKEDIMPSQVTKQWLIADEVENFLLLCTEYCGDNHAYMIAGISVHA